MSRATIYSVIASALLASLAVFPLWLSDFSVVDIVFGRYLVFGLLMLMIFAFRRDAFRYYRRQGGLCWRNTLLIALTTNIIYYLCLIMAVRLLGGLAGLFLLALLPMVFLLMQRQSAGNRLSRWLPLFLIIAALFVMMLDHAAFEENCTHKDRLGYGVLWLLLSGISWLWGTRRQVELFRRYPEIDRSDHFIISGINTLLALVVLLPLAMMGIKEWQLFSYMDASNSSRFLLGVLLAGFMGTLVARLLWNYPALYGNNHSTAFGATLEPGFVAVYAFLWERRWPDTAEYVVLGLCALALWMFFRSWTQLPYRAEENQTE